MQRDVRQFEQFLQELALPSRYEPGVELLIDWSNKRSEPCSAQEFANIVNYSIKICERWSSHGWSKDQANIEATKRSMADHKKVMRSISDFRRNLKLAPNGKAEIYLGFSILREFVPDTPVPKSSIGFRSAVKRGLRKFEQLASQGPDLECRYGPLGYEVPPVRCTSPEVAIAIALGDRISFLRKDSYRDGSGWRGVKPVFSKKLPWTAIASFCTANFDDPEARIDGQNIQTLVISHAARVAKVSPI